MTQRKRRTAPGYDASRTAPSHAGSLGHSAAILQRLLFTIVPNGSPAAIVAVFNSRTSYGTIQQWRHGRRHVPNWARDIIRDKAKTIAELAEQLPAGPGMQAGWCNLSGRTANRPKPK